MEQSLLMAKPDQVKLLQFKDPLFRAPMEMTLLYRLPIQVETCMSNVA